MLVTSETGRYTIGRYAPSLTPVLTLNFDDQDAYLLRIVFFKYCYDAIPGTIYEPYDKTIFQIWK